MPQTTWELILKPKGGAAAAKMAGQVRGLTGELGELTRAAPAAQRAIEGLFGAGTVRNLRTTLGLMKQVNAEMRRMGSAPAARTPGTSRQSRAPSASRTIVDGVRRGSGGLAGRTRIDGGTPRDGAGGRTRQEGMFTPSQAARLPALGALGRQQEAARAQRANQSALRANQNYFQQLSRLNQRSFAETRQNQRTLEQDRRRAEAAHTQRVSQNIASGHAAMSSFMGIIGQITSVLATVLATVGAIGGAFAAIAAQVGMATLRMIAFREGALTTLRTMARGTGRGEQARRQLRDTQQFARETPQTQEQLVGLRNSISTAGFTGRTSDDILRASADVGSANPNDATASDRFVYALGQVRSRGSLAGDELRQLTQIGGVSREAIFEQIARSRGMLQGGQAMDTATTRRVEQLIQSRRVTGDEGVNAVLGSVRQNLNNGGELGGFARSQGGTLLGTLSNLEESFFQFVTSINDIENLPGLKMLKGVLTGIANTLAGATPVGRELQRIFAGIVDSVGMWVGSVAGKNGPEAFFRTILTTATEAWPVVRQIFSAFSGPFVAQLRSQLGPFVSQLGDQGLVGTLRTLIPYAAAFGNLLGFFAGLFIRAGIAAAQFGAMVMRVASSMTDVVNLMLAPVRAIMTLVSGLFTGIGTAMTGGIVQGIRAGAGAVWTEITGVVGGAVDSVKGALGIHSPSRVFADEVGRQIPAGIAMGARDGASALDRTMEGLVPVPGAGGLGGLGASLSVTIQMTSSGDPQADGETAGRAALDVLLRGLEPYAFAGG